jgi:class 3 adenylate cyclase
MALAIAAFFVWLTIDGIQSHDGSFLTDIDLMWQDSKFRFGGGRQLRSEAAIVGIDMVYLALLFTAHRAVNVGAFVWLRWELGFVYPGLALVSVGGGLIAYKYFTRERERKRTKRTFQHHLGPHVIERVMSRPGMLKLGGEKREISVLFSSIRGFASFSENMAPDEVVQFLKRYFDRMTGLIFKKEGTLDKLIGGAVMCFWGHPLDHRDHAARAVVCALEMVQAVEDLRPVLILPGGARFEIGVGVNTGPMVVGDMGSQARMSYTVMGDNVNLGSRLESLNKHYGTRILISDATYRDCKDVVSCREIDTIQVKGRNRAVTIYEPLGVHRPRTERREVQERRGPLTRKKRAKRAFVLAFHGDRRKADRRRASERILVTPAQEELASAYADALAFYRAGDFDAAGEGFGRVLDLYPGDGPSRLMKARMAQLRLEHGAEESFDPVYKFDGK